jgi:3-oxoacyl-[acyl-carrier protein] reductase
MNIVVTGASSGIGYEVVKQFSTKKEHTIFAVSRNGKKLEQLAAECTHKNVIPIVCDLSNADSVAALIIEIKKHTPILHAILNNAGAIINKPFAALSITDFEYVYQVNVFSAVRLIQGLLPMMDEQKKSHIVNVSSMGGFQGSAKFAGLSAYSSSKAALVCLTECLAEEFKERNIAFNCLALGAVQTEMLAAAFPGYKAPLSASEMATYIAQFLLNGHQFMNGKVIPVSLSTP